MPYSYMLDSSQEYQIKHQREVTWEQGLIRALASITLYRETLSPPPAGGAQSTNFGLLAAIS